MDIYIESYKVVICHTGIQFIKLKSEICRRLGSHIKSTKDRIEFPLSALPIVHDLLDVNFINREDIKSCLAMFNDHSIARLEAIEIVKSGSVKNLTSEWLEILDPAQSIAVAAMILPRILGLCLFDEQGSGKTIMSIAAFDILKENNQIDGMIVVCPKSMVSEWPKDIARFTSNKYNVVQVDGNRSQKYDAALSRFDILVSNYESVEIILSTLISSTVSRRFLLVIDESYYLKNSGAIRSEVIGKLRKQCTRCFVLCGTPAPNSAHDLVNQFDLADLGYTFGTFVKSKDPLHDLPEIERLIDSKGLFIRRLKTETLKHVPEKNFHILKSELKGKQALMYEKARSELELVLRNLNNETFKKALATYLQRRSVLLQICSCPRSIDPTFSEEPVKYEVLDKLLHELISQNRKVVVWSFFTSSLDEMYERYSRYNPVRVDGTVTSNRDRTSAVISFQEDTETKLFIGNPAAAGAGITLHAAYDAVYVSFSNQAAHYLQSLDRIHRRGQLSDHVNYYFLICSNTIEESEISRLRQKELSQHTLLGDQFKWPNSLDEALADLLKHD